jgi:anti-anti-sigma factor
VSKRDLARGHARAYTPLMRRNGVLRPVDELGPCDHACWLYDDDAQFRAQAARFLEDGLRLGQRLLYIGERAEAQLRADLRERLPQCDELIDADALRVSSISGHYERPSEIAPEEQLRRFIDATQQAIADGYRGLRLVADVGSLVTEPEDRAARARTEHLAERFMAAGNPLAALCCYDARRVEPSALQEIACVHPLVRGRGASRSFRLFGDGAQLALGGEVDHFNAPVLERALCNVESGSIDLSALEFIDHRGLLALARRHHEVSAQGGSLRFGSIPPVVHTMLQILGESLENGSGAQPVG